MFRMPYLWDSADFVLFLLFSLAIISQDETQPTRLYCTSTPVVCQHIYVLSPFQSIQSKSIECLAATCGMHILRQSHAEKMNYRTSIADVVIKWYVKPVFLDQ